MAPCKRQLMGDFNSCTLDTALPSFHQYVHVPTRNNKTIGLSIDVVVSALCVKLVNFVVQRLDVCKSECFQNERNVHRLPS